MATPIDLTATRLAAARNTGIVVEFQRDQGRAFTGSIADYQALTQDQQFRLVAEMSKILKAQATTLAAAGTPVNTGTQAVVARLGSIAPPPGPTVLEDIVSGAGEGLAAIPGQIASTVKYTNSLVGTAFTAAAGQSLGSIATKLGIAAIAVGAVYLFVVSGGAEKTIARIATRKRKKS